MRWEISEVFCDIPAFHAGGEIMNIGIDLGGHTLSAALVGDDGTIVKKREIMTPSGRNPSEVIRAMQNMIEELASGQPCCTVGIGIPGMLDVQREQICKLPNFPGWEGLNIRKVMGKSVSFPVFVENDANCYALGEGKAGKAKGIRNFAVFTLGTGIGGGIVWDGNLLTGAHGMAGEFGHIATGSGEMICGCGAFGHLETVSAADGIEGEAGKAGLPHDMVLLWKARQEKEVRPVWDRALHSLARAVASVIHILDPELIILGGGISRAEGFVNELQPFLQRYVSPVFLPYLNIETSTLGNDAALIGAASLGTE
jgi:glucokinase